MPFRHARLLRHAPLVAGLGVAVVLLAGCNLKLATAGARCTKVGDYAQDGTYVLKCTGAHTWARGIRVSVADAALAALTAPRTPPTGTVDSVTVAPGQARVVGWAVDPDTPAPITVRVTVDGVTAASVTASVPRADLVASQGALGSNHGFDVAVSPSPGGHRLCAVAVNNGPGGDTTVGCRAVVMPQIQPRGSFDAVAAEGTRLTASGWADDPDGSGPSTVRVSWQTSTLGDPTTTTVVGSIARGDLAAAGIATDRGWSATFTPTAGGPVTVCATVVNQGLGTDQSLGCRTVTVVDHRPQGSVDSVAPSGTHAVSLQGWAADPDGGGPLTVRISVDGAVTTVTANRSRPDVGAVFPAFGNSTGWSATVSSLSAGEHSVCVTAVDVATSAPGVTGDRSFPCGAVILGATSGSLSIGVPGTVSAPTPVGPPAGHPATGVDRDGGVSVTLGDGSTLWLFGDSSAVDPSGRLRYLVNNSAAWAPAGTPATTHDPAATQVSTFLDPGPSFPACSNPAATRAEWPMSASVEHLGSFDHVIAYVQNMCITSLADVASAGVGVAEWWYDATSPPDGRTIRFTLLNQQLFPRPTYGTASIATGGYVYAYSCDGPGNGGAAGRYGPCHVARVATTSVADSSAYTYWNGSGWSTSSSAAADLVMPDGTNGTVDPVAAFNVAYDPALGVYEMGYSPWPGYTDRLDVRFSTSPVGPWTPPVEVVLPGCQTTVGGVGYYCYAAAVQPQASSGGAMGIGFYDQAVSVGPRRGAYLIASASIAVSVVP